MITENMTITTESIAETIGITRRQVESNMRELKLRGILERQGGRRYGRWVVILDCKDNKITERMYIVKA